MKSTLTMEELKDGEFTSAYGEMRYFKDIPEYVNTQCSTKTYTYKTPYFQFEVQEGFSVKYYTKKGGHRDYAVIVLQLDKAEKVPEDCSDKCVANHYEIRIFMSAYIWESGKYTELIWPLEKSSHAIQSSRVGTPPSFIDRTSSKIAIQRNLTTRSDKTKIIARWKTYSFIETSLRKRKLEILLPNGIVILLSPTSGSTHEVTKLEDCFLDTVIKTIKPR